MAALLGALTGALIGAPGAASAQDVYLGPRTLYPNDHIQASHPEVPLVIRDAVQHIASGSRLIALKPRIIGGEPAPEGQYPWVASIELKGANPRDGHFCGGAFIGAEWVMTAAHCLKADTADKIQVHSGAELENGGVIYGADRVIVNEKYDDGTQDNDVALIHLNRRYDGQTVRPITAAEADRIASPGALGIALGWGLTTEGGQVSNILRRVTVQILNNKVCNSVASYAGAISDVMVCAGFAEGGKDSCQGDSGGPLVIRDPNEGFLQVGIVSWGEGCGRPLKFGVYTRVSVVEPWVAEHTGIRRTPIAGAPAPAPQTGQAERREPGPPAPRVRSNSRVELPGALRAQAKKRPRGHKAAAAPRRKLAPMKHRAALSRAEEEGAVPQTGPRDVPPSAMP